MAVWRGFFMCKRCNDVMDCSACLLCGKPLCPKYHGVWDDTTDDCPHKSYMPDTNTKQDEFVKEVKEVKEVKASQDIPKSRSSTLSSPSCTIS